MLLKGLIEINLSSSSNKKTKGKFHPDLAMIPGELDPQPQVVDIRKQRPVGTNAGSHPSHNVSQESTEQQTDPVASDTAFIMWTTVLDPEMLCPKQPRSAIGVLWQL